MLSHGILTEEHRHSISLVQRKSPCILKYTCILICGYSWGGCVSLIHFQRMTAPRESITAITTKIIMHVLAHWETCNSIHLKLPPESNSAFSGYQSPEDDWEDLLAIFTKIVLIILQRIFIYKSNGDDKQMASALTSYCFETAAFKPNLRLPARETEQFPGRWFYGNRKPCRPTCSSKKA